MRTRLLCLCCLAAFTNMLAGGVCVALDRLGAASLFGLAACVFSYASSRLSAP